ncbi:PAS domain-containing sensor histidine kinase [Hydrogenophaga sp.]|uniref:PAS domain-containing sensor histidine kinase n=1 Tax=Hydrogenophaga sp. TaxID=1904254 RepID=UPI00271E09D1|nr:PAS domain-containing sensor histidine kinase [Hydrogenophaga sp.]MDO9434931.1 PAS domain-containing sensor histidine kinase [Hydrogenophaga sp.]
MTLDLSGNGNNSPRRPLLTSADRFQLVVEAIQDYAIYMLDPEGRIESWSPGAERMKGYKADEVLGKSYSMFFRQVDVDEGLPNWQLARARLHGKTEEEGWRLRKDGSAFWANVLVSVIRDEQGELIGYAKITRDITERLRLREHERSLQRMNEFLAVLGHELRAPLSSIRYATAYLAGREAQDDKQANASRILNRQIDLLTRLLDELLDAGRVTSGKLRVSLQRTEFKRLVEHAVELVSPAIEERAQRLDVVLPEGQIWMNADEIRITQVLHNLLSNASKFTQTGGHIRLNVEITDDRLIVEIADNGLGMDPAVIDGLFHLFKQAPTPQENHQSGLGIGLALSRAIVEMHGGKITGSSAGAHRGSVFRVELPMPTKKG